MVDLHTHSTASDGSCTPAELAGMAAQAGLSWLALTDHNTTAGLPAFLSAAQKAGIRGVPGAEISCQFAGREVHILALDLPEKAFSQLEAVLAEALSWARESKIALTESLTRAGYPVSFEDIQRAHPGSILNRAHIALALVEKGFAPSVEAAFAAFLTESAGFYRPPRRLLTEDVIPMILDLGAVPVWAHPLLYHGEGEVREALDALVPRGLRGMETYYSTYTPAKTSLATALAERYHLKKSGGSDFHGRSKPDIPLGWPQIPESVAEELVRR